MIKSFLSEALTTPIKWFTSAYNGWILKRWFLTHLPQRFLNRRINIIDILTLHFLITIRCIKWCYMIYDMIFFTCFFLRALQILFRWFDTPQIKRKLKELALLDRRSIRWIWGRNGRRVCRSITVHHSTENISELLVSVQRNIANIKE